jgi:hypothetical protein
MSQGIKLDTQTEYTWFISNIDTRVIKDVPTLVFDWTCKETTAKIREYLRICRPFKGCRLYNTMKALGWDEEKNPDMKPEDFFVRGLHIKAKPLMYWSEMNSELMLWKLNYETLLPMEETSASLSDEDMRMLTRISATKGSYNETLAHLATHRVELVEPFISLCKQDKITFTKK